jgi:hypothetical protein
MCEAFLDIPLNFVLWRYFFNVKFTRERTDVVGR